MNNNGKRVFFLYPQSVIQDEMVYEIVRNEYEAYLIWDHKKIVQDLKNNDESFLFINIDSEEMSSNEWEKFCKNIIQDDSLPVQIGIMTYNNDPELAQKYLMDIGVTCGFIVLKLGLEKSKEIILKTLDANEAKGRRKYVRATCSDGSATLNLKQDGKLIDGEILDMSSVGFSCTFSSAIEIPKGSLLKAVQLRLRSKIVMVDAVVFGKRAMDDGRDQHVLLFSNTVKPQEKIKIHRFIYDYLQSNLNSRLGL